MIDQEEEIRQMKIEAQIRKNLDNLYNLLLCSDNPEAETQLGYIAEFKAFWEGDR